MTQDRPLRISRRKVLAGLGAVGLASAGAGLGTTAYFSDREDFQDNVLTAGELDLKVDWQHMYYGAEVSEVYGPAGRPYVNAYPDTDSDGQQDTVMSRTDIQTANPSWTVAEVEAEFRTQFANIPDDFDAPVVSLDDVKPGDHGCLNVSLHLFDNPGYLVMGSELYAEAENGQNEPESKADATPDAGELGDAVRATLWYDDDNDCEVSGGIEEDGAIAIVLDRSGSMASEAGKFEGAKDGAKQLVDALGANTEIALVSYSSDANLDVSLTTDKSAVKTAVDGLSAGGTTNMGDAVTTAAAELGNSSSSNKVMVFLTNGTPTAGPDPVAAASTAKGNGIDIYTIAYGSDANESKLQQMSSDPDSQYSYLAVNIASIEQVFSQIGQVLAGEEIIMEGTLAEVFAALADGVELDGNRHQDGRQCFVNSTTQHVALKWELPADVGNEIQTDSLTFDLSFYAEQCRHNDEPTNPFNETATQPTTSTTQ